MADELSVGMTLDDGPFKSGLNRATKQVDVAGKQIQQAGAAGSAAFAKWSKGAMQVVGGLLAVGGMVAGLKRVAAGVAENIGLTKWWNDEIHKAIQTYSRALGAAPKARDLGIGDLVKEAEKANVSLALLKKGLEEAEAAAREAGKPLDPIVVALRQVIAEAKKTDVSTSHVLSLARALGITAEDAKKVAAAYAKINEGAASAEAMKLKAEQLAQHAKWLQDIGASFDRVEQATRDAAVAQEMYNKVAAGMPLDDATRAAEKFGESIDIANEKMRQAGDAAAEGFVRAADEIEEASRFTAEGFGRGMREAALEMQDLEAVGADVARGLQSSFKSFFFDMFKNGVADIQSLLASLADLALDVLSNLISSQLTSSIIGAFGGGLAHGGNADPGRTYVVGERGPEVLRMGRQGGQVVPIQATRSERGGSDSGRQVTVNMTIQAMDAASFAAFAHANRRTLSRLLQEMIGGADQQLRTSVRGA